MNMTITTISGKQRTNTMKLHPIEFLYSVDVLRSISSSYMKSEQPNPELQHFQNLLLGFLVEFEMNFLIALLQPQTGISDISIK